MPDCAFAEAYIFRYIPLKPSSFVCQPTAMLLSFSSGEVEIFSKNKRCNKKIFDYPKFSTTGHTISLLDTQLIIAGKNGQIGTKWDYITILSPRDGLLAVKYTREISPITGNPHRHTSFSEGNTLVLLGGDQRARARLDSKTWNGLTLRWKNNGSTFSRHTFAACSVRLLKDSHLIIGGVERGQASNHVFRVNITEESVEQLPQIELSRAYHSCEITDKGLIIISGGTKETLTSSNRDVSTLPDELYPTNNLQTTKVVLNRADSLGRYQHRLFRLEDTVYAVGGQTSNGSQPSIVEMFNSTSFQWYEDSEHVLSRQTGELAVTPFPMAAVDCVQDCTCGLRAQQRIVNGIEAEVAFHILLSTCNRFNVILCILFSAYIFFFKANSYPWMAAILRNDENYGDSVYSRCSATLVSRG